MQPITRFLFWFGWICSRLFELGLAREASFFFFVFINPHFTLKMDQFLGRLLSSRLLSTSVPTKYVLHSRWAVVCFLQRHAYSISVLLSTKLYAGFTTFQYSSLPSEWGGTDILWISETKWQNVVAATGRSDKYSARFCQFSPDFRFAGCKGEKTHMKANVAKAFTELLNLCLIWQRQHTTGKICTLVTIVSPRPFGSMLLTAGSEAVWLAIAFYMSCLITTCRVS